MYYDVPTQHGRRFIVTGANSGIGFEATRRLALAGAEIVMAVRTPAKGEAARAAIAREAPGAVLDVRPLDVADLASVRAFAASVVADGRPVHGLLNNAGIMIPPARYATTDGFELQFGTNFLGPFALTNLLLPRLIVTPGARVATMSSSTAAWGKISFDDLNWERRKFGPQASYAQSKLADLLLATQLAAIAEQRGWDLLSTAAHPGYTRTNLLTAGRNLGRDGAKQLAPAKRTLIPSQDVSTGVEPLLTAATSPLAASGAYYGPSRMGLVGPTKRIALPRAARSAEVAARLWSVAEELTGVTTPTTSVVAP